MQVVFIANREKLKQSPFTLAETSTAASTPKQNWCAMFVHLIYILNLLVWNSIYK